jgi:hypothetical protein
MPRAGITKRRTLPARALSRELPQNWYCNRGGDDEQVQGGFYELFFVMRYRATTSYSASAIRPKLSTAPTTPASPLLISRRGFSEW